MESNAQDSRCAKRRTCKQKPLDYTGNACLPHLHSFISFFVCTISDRNKIYVIDLEAAERNYVVCKPEVRQKASHDDQESIQVRGVPVSQYDSPSYKIIR